MSSENVLELQGITKAYKENVALNNLSFSVRRGEIHGLLGDNGAGKTTLLKLLTGLLPPDSYTGQVWAQGQPVLLTSPSEAIKHHIGIVPRRPGIFTGLTIADNVVLGKEMRGLIVNQAKMRDDAVKLMEIVGLKLEPSVKANSLTASQQRLIMIARALSMDTQVIVLDEPAAFLTTAQDLSQLFRALRSLAERNIATLYMTRRPAEAIQIADRISVLRDGEIVAEWQRVDFDETTMMKQMQTQRIGDAGYVDYDDLNQQRGWLDGLRNLFGGNRS
ncbi:MAG: ATP-binding cassette domain-containing protein [Anaerolineae bacterium]|jgi:ABC-type sugar transport system ATPase subunit|nr:ATP-binding cassette domain-containing protein [Anaerolineae bacterium]